MEDKSLKYKYALPTGRTILTGGNYAYRIEKVLGQGGFGITYLASTTIELGTTKHKVFFAIKEFFSEQELKCYREKNGTEMLFSPAASQEVKKGIDDFQEEAKRLSRICKHNENIVHVNEVFRGNGTAYYAMEYLDGSNLREICQRKKTKCFAEADALAIIRPIIKAVSYIHEEHQLLHLDIKPENIMMCGEKPVLIDFGVALHFNKKGNLTSTNKSLAGTTGFAPREQTTGFGITHFSPEADVYALAATLFYLLVGKTPLSAFDITPEYIQKELEAKGVSERTCKAIMHGMEVVKENRTPTAKVLLEELEQEKSIPKNDPLPMNHALRLGNQEYRIVRVLETGECYIKYEAIRFVASTSNDANLTIKKTYPVYEFFVKDLFERQQDGSVNAPTSEATKNDFDAFCLRLAKKNYVSSFDINGTTYLLTVKKPKPPVPWRIILTTASIFVLFLGGLMLFYSIFSNKGNEQSWGTTNYAKKYPNDKLATLVDSLNNLTPFRWEGDEKGPGGLIEHLEYDEKYITIYAESNLRSSSVFIDGFDGYNDFLDNDWRFGEFYLGECVKKGVGIKFKIYSQFHKKLRVSEKKARSLKVVLQCMKTKVFGYKDQKGVYNFERVESVEKYELETLESCINDVLGFDKEEYTKYDRYEEYIDTLIWACNLNKELKLKAKKAGIEPKNFDSLLRQKVKAEYEGNMKATQNPYLPTSAKATCEKYLNRIKTKAKDYYK